MYLDFLVKVPTVKGKITRRKKSNVVYIEYEYDRVYDPSRKYTFLKRVTIGKLSDTDPELMKPNQNFLKYFPDAELPESKNRTSRSSCLRVGTYFVLRKIIEECSLNDILGKYFGSRDMDVSEDLARRIINQQNLLLSFSQSVSVLKTRELTQTRIQRALLHIILNIHTAPTQTPFARVLGFRRESSELLSQIKQHSRIPLITKLADAQNLLDSEGNQILSETVFSSNLYEKLLCLKTGRKFCHESQKQLIIL